MRKNNKSEIKNKNKKNTTNTIQHIEINKLIQPHKKIKYCSLISKILKNNNKNNRKLKPPIIYSIIEFLNFYEKISVRIMCKQWNDIIKQKLSFLSQENFINCVVNNSAYKTNNTNSNNVNRSLLASYKKTSRKSVSNLNNSNNLISDSSAAQSGINNTQIQNNLNIKNINSNGMNKENNFYFDHSDKKFSKKKVLVKLINSKNFNTIKNKVSLGEMTQSRVLKKE